MMLMMIPVVMVVMACYGDSDDKVDIDPSTFLEHWSRISSHSCWFAQRCSWRLRFGMVWPDGIERQVSATINDSFCTWVEIQHIQVVAEAQLRRQRTRLQIIWTAKFISNFTMSVTIAL